MLQKPGSSRIGLDTAMDDVVYSVINEINPKINQGQQEIAGRIAGNLQNASQKIGSVMDPIRQTQVDTQGLNRDMFQMSQ